METLLNCELLWFNFYHQPFKMIAWAFNWILSQIAWTIIRFEIHHLWNPDWTYAFPNNFETVRDQQVPDRDGSEQLPEPIEEEDVFLTGEEMDTTTVNVFWNIFQFFIISCIDFRKNNDGKLNLQIYIHYRPIHWLTNFLSKMVGQFRCCKWLTSIKQPPNLATNRLHYMS